MAHVRKEALKTSFEDGLAELAPTLESFRKRLVPELGIREFPDAKVLWKVMSLYQCLIRRTLELIDGIEQSWDQQQHLISVTLARSLVETSAFTWNLTMGIERGVKERDLGIIDKFVMDQGHATRIPSWLEEGFPKATSILTLIDKMDRDLDARTGMSRMSAIGDVRHTYDLLSDFSHPNWLGVTSLYPTRDWDNMRYLFAPLTEETRRRLGGTLSGALASVIVMEYCLRQMDKLVEPLHELNNVVPYK